MLRRIGNILFVIILLSYALGLICVAESGGEPAEQANTQAPEITLESKKANTTKTGIRQRKARASANPRASSEVVTEPSLLRINIIKSYAGFPRRPGERPLVGTSGAVADKFIPLELVTQAATGLVFDEKGHIIFYAGNGWIDLRSPNTRIEIVNHEGQVAQGQLVGIDERKGFAVVRCSELKQVKPAPLAQVRSIPVGSPIKKIEPGRVAALRAIYGRIDRWSPGSEGVAAFEGSGHQFGGPILANDGRVLGMAIGKIQTAGPGHRSQEAIIPTAELLPGIRHIVNTGESVASGWIGVYIYDIHDLTSEVRRRFNVKVEHGVIVRDVTKGSPAERAGIQAGDIIQKIHQQIISNAPDFVRRIEDMQPGQTVTLNVLRGGTAKDMPVTIEKRRLESAKLAQSRPLLEINAPEFMAKLQALQQRFQQMVEERKRRLRTARLDAQDYRKLEQDFEDRKRELIEAHVRTVPSRPNYPIMGVVCYDLSVPLGEFLGIKNGKGVLVNAVLPITPADRAGIKPGDAIIRIEGREMMNCRDLLQEVRERRVGDKIKVTILREAKSLDFYVTLDKRVP